MCLHYFTRFTKTLCLNDQLSLSLASVEYSVFLKQLKCLNLSNHSF